MKEEMRAQAQHGPSQAVLTLSSGLSWATGDMAPPLDQGRSPLWLTREAAAGGPFLALMGVRFVNMKASVLYSDNYCLCV